MKTIKLVLACLMVMQLLILWIFSMNIMFTNQEDEPINIVGQTIKISDQKWLVECWGGDPVVQNLYIIQVSYHMNVRHVR